MREDSFTLQIEKLKLWEIFWEKCKEQKNYAAIQLVYDVGKYAVTKSKTIIGIMPEFTLHDDVHIFNMLHIVDKLLPQETMRNLSTPDILLIFLSIFLHDIGMCPPQRLINIWKGETEPLNFEEEKEYEKYHIFEKSYGMYLQEKEELKQEGNIEGQKLITEFIIREYIRKEHAERTRQYIYQDWNEKIIYKGNDLGSILAQICYSHNEDYKYVLKLEPLQLCGDGEYICVPFIAVILRLADIIDFDPKRAPKILFSHLSIRNPVSIKEWEKHMSVNAWTIEPNLLMFSAKCENPATELAIRNFCDLIDEELKNATYIMARIHTLPELESKLDKYKQIVFPHQVNRNQIGAKVDYTGHLLYRYHETAFTLSKNQVIDLLMGTKLYQSKEVALRELLQNSIDACILRKKICRHYKQPYNPNIMVCYYEKDGNDFLEVADNGIGMDQNIIDRYYTQIGTSFYRSNEFNDLKAQLDIEFQPISKFGIGILACFMVSNEITVDTMRVQNEGKYGEPIKLQVEGYDSLFVIKDGDIKQPGTYTTLKLRKDHPWKEMKKEEFIGCVLSTLKNPPFPININYKEGDTYIYSQCDEQFKNDLKRIKKTWIMAPNIDRIDFNIDMPQFGFKGRVSIAYITEERIPVDQIEMHMHNIDIDGKTYEMSASYTYDKYGIFRTSDSLELANDNSVTIVQNTSTTMPSYAEVSLKGITIPSNMFRDFNNDNQMTIINFPLPTLLVLDVYDKTEINLNTARTNAIYDSTWLDFERKIIFTLCLNLRKRLRAKKWRALQAIIIDKMPTKELKELVQTMKL